MDSVVKFKSLRTNPWLWAGAILFLLALFTLRIWPAGAERFAVDEAHHSGWARLIANGDPFMRTIAADKPPQLYYLIALSFKLFGENEISARLPNVLAGTLLILPLWGIARRLYPSRIGVALLACALYALSPLAQVYAPTAFTDPLMVFWLVMCVWLVTGQRWFWAGLALGLAICAKQQALFFLPFPVFLGLIELFYQPKSGPAWSWRTLAGRLTLVVGGLALPLALVLGFDKWRGQTSSLTYGAALNGEKLGLAYPVAWPGRLGEWWNRVLQYFFAPGWFGLLLALALLLYGGWTLARLARLWQNRHADNSFSTSAVQGVLADTALLTATLIVLGWHTAMTFPVWDRYLLPLVPFVALLLARTLTAVAGVLRSFFSNRAGTSRLNSTGIILAGLALFVFIFMAQPLVEAATYRLPLGGDYLAFSGEGPGAHSAYDGIQQIGPYLKASLPPGAVVYAEEMDWEFSYYLFGVPVELPSNKSRPLDPAVVAASAEQKPAYVIYSDWQGSSYQKLQNELSSLGYRLEPVREIQPGSNPGRTSFTIYSVKRV
ncbi:MAG TPA: glycosyltransferase family 39 protein [Chloroflexia bacterium]|nr:glycosyltransferase family 39 protein [Chloroflexia bacterium]